MNERLKVYLETSFVSYLTGRPMTEESIAARQADSRQWWAAVAPLSWPTMATTLPVNSRHQ